MVAWADNERHQIPEGMIGASQPRRVDVPPRTHRSRSWPCGTTEGGWLCGDGDACRAADVVIEDWVSPPLHVQRNPKYERSMKVDSTHTETRITGVRKDGLTYKVHTFEHPEGLR